MLDQYENSLAGTPGNAGGQPTPATAVPQITVLDRAGQVQRVVALSEPILTVGSAPGNTIVLDSSAVSRYQLRITWDGQQAQVTNLSTRQSSLLSGAALPPQTTRVWEWGQDIELDSTRLRLNRPTPRRNGTHGAGAVPAGVRSDTGRIAVSLEGNQEILELTPGQPTVVRAMVTNRGHVPDRVTLDVEGVPATWVQVPSEPLEVRPNRPVPIPLQILVPRTTENRAGENPVTIRARSQNNLAETGSTTTRWAVLPFAESHMELHPRKRIVRGLQQTTYVVTLQNLGNATTFYSLQAGEEEPGLDYSLEQPRIIVEPGKSANLRLGVQAREKPAGKLQNYTFGVEATSATQETLAAVAQLEQRAPFPFWVIPAVATLLLLLLVGGAWAAGAFNNDDENAVVQGESTTETVSPTDNPTTQPSERPTEVDMAGTVQAIRAVASQDALLAETQIAGTVTAAAEMAAVEQTETADFFQTSVAATEQAAVNRALQEATSAAAANQAALAQTTLAVAGGNVANTTGNGSGSGGNSGGSGNGGSSGGNSGSGGSGGSGSGSSGSGSSDSGDNGDDSSSEDDEEDDTTTATPVPTPVPTATPGPRTISVSSANGIEGGSIIFEVSLSGPANAENVTVDYTTEDDSAIAPEDYTPDSNTLVFGPSETRKNIAIALQNDNIREGQEQFELVLSNPVNGLLGTDSALGVIRDADGNSRQPEVFISGPPPVNEGDSATISVSLSTIPPESVTVNYVIRNGTAVNPADYTSETTSGSLEFDAGDTTLSREIKVNIEEDNLDEDNEDFHVTLTSVEGATLASSQSSFTVRITDDDPEPTLSISIDEPAILEGNADDTKQLDFTISLSAASGREVKVNYATDAVTAEENDFLAQSETVTFPAETTEKTISIAIFGEEEVEVDETFRVILSNPVNATIANNAVATGTIIDDDGPPRLSISDMTFNEQDTNATFTVTLSAPLPGSQPVEVNYTMQPGSGVAGATSNDFEDKSAGTISFEPSKITQSIPVKIKRDNIVELNEEFAIEITGFSEENRITIDDGTATGTIIDNDGPAVISFERDPVEEIEPETENEKTTATFTVTLSPRTSFPVTVTYEVRPVNTEPRINHDYTIANPRGELYFGPDQGFEKPITVNIKNDSDVEIEENFLVVLRDIKSSVPVEFSTKEATLTAIGTIIDQDLPKVSFSNEGQTVFDNQIAIGLQLDQPNPRDDVTVKLTFAQTGFFDSSSNTITIPSDPSGNRFITPTFTLLPDAPAYGEITVTFDSLENVESGEDNQQHTITLINENKVVLLEAENFNSRTPVSVDDQDYQWESRDSNNTAPLSDTVKYGGTGYICILPSDGQVFDDPPNSPELRYEGVEFPEANTTYYVWIRGWGRSDKTDSAHIGINNAVSVKSIDTDDHNEWVWINEQDPDDVPGASLTILTTTANIHIWARDTGFCIDQILFIPVGPEQFAPNDSNVGPAIGPISSGVIAQVAPSTRVLAAGYGAGSTAGPVSSTLPQQWPAAAFRRDPWWYDPWHLFAHQRTRLRPWSIRGAGSAGL